MDQKTLSNEDKKVSAAAKLCQYEIAEAVRSNTRIPINDAVIVAAHLLSLALKYNCPFEVPFEAVLRDSDELGIDISDLARKAGLDETWEKLSTLTRRYDTKVFNASVKAPMPVLDKSSDAETPAAITRIAAKLLNLQTTDNAADFCCGKAASLLELEAACPEVRLVGIELNADSTKLAETRLYAASSNAQVINADVFAKGSETVAEYDKIFSNYPFKISLKNLLEGKVYLEKVSEKVPGIQKANSSDWLFNHLVLDSLKTDGKAVCVMTMGSTVNGNEQEIRKYFVENGFVETVIALPNKLFSTFSIPTALIVLSYGNQNVRMVDATKQCAEGRRQNVITDENIDYIINACQRDTAISKVVGIEDLRASDYVLSPSRYFEQQVILQDAVPFGTVIKSITRGAHCSADQLDAMASQEDTNTYFLKTSDIQDGVISGQLQCLSYIESNFLKYCLHNGDLLISKTGIPYKTAVVEMNTDVQILANANLYVITIDESKADPYYLQAFLESNEGQKQLRNITVGTTIPSVGVKDLKSMLVPLPPLVEQKKVAAAYKAAIDEVVQRKQELKAATERMGRIFEEYNQ